MDPNAGQRDHNLYEHLEVPRAASTEQIKQAYRILALKHHPDKGGDPHKFAEISRAFTVLSDPDQRALYDATCTWPDSTSNALPHVAIAPSCIA